MPRGMPRGGWPDGAPDKTKIRLEENKNFCEAEYCYRKIWSWEKYCDSCELNRCPERAKYCLVCYKKHCIVIVINTIRNV